MYEVHLSGLSVDEVLFFVLFMGPLIPTYHVLIIFCSVWSQYTLHNVAQNEPGMSVSTIKRVGPLLEKRVGVVIPAMKQVVCTVNSKQKAVHYVQMRCGFRRRARVCERVFCLTL
jgi:hypothetical protein